MKKQIVCLAVLCAVGFSTAQGASCLGKDPVETARNFHKKYRDFYARDTRPFASVLTPTFASVLQRNYDCQVREQGICAVDVDPWTNAQDGDVYNPRFGIQTTVGELQATVAMDYLFKFDKKEKGKPQSIKLQLTRRDVKSCWLVDEFYAPDGVPLTRTIRKGLEPKH